MARRSRRARACLRIDHVDVCVCVCACACVSRLEDGEEVAVVEALDDEAVEHRAEEHHPRREGRRNLRISYHI